MVDGMSPQNSLFEMSKFVSTSKFPHSLGRIPVIKFDWISKFATKESLPNSDGSEEENMFRLNRKCFTPVNSPSSEGMLPVKLLSSTWKNEVNSVSLPNSDGRVLAKLLP